MPERHEDLRLQIAAERQGLNEDLGVLQDEARSLAIVAAGVTAAVVVVVASARIATFVLRRR